MSETVRADSNAGNRGGPLMKRSLHSAALLVLVGAGLALMAGVVLDSVRAPSPAAKGPEEASPGCQVLV